MMLRFSEIKSSFVALTTSTIEDTSIVANEDKDAFKNVDKPAFIELSPQPLSSGKYVERSVIVYIRFHDRNSTNLSRLTAFEKMVKALRQPLKIGDRFILPVDIAYEEIEHVLEVKCTLKFNDGNIEIIENEFMEQLEYEGGI